jgi:DNA-binding transcriptional regulator YhcF (GntR family)
MHENLTIKQQAALDFIRDYLCANCCAPTYKDVATHFGVYPNAAQSTVDSLRKKGFIKAADTRVGIILANTQCQLIEVNHG